MSCWRNLMMYVSVLSTIAHAQDLGSFGATFPIAEDNFLDHLTQKLQALQQSGDLRLHQDILAQRLKRQLETPAPVQGMTETHTQRRFTYDPSIIASQDLRDAKGRVFVKKGQRINPLDVQPLTKPLIFIDATKTMHRAWARRQQQTHPFAKIILVKGNPFTLMRQQKEPVYFDQGGALTRKLGIRHVPAIVTQADKVLLISEEVPHE